MLINLKITRSLFNQMYSDLIRPHPFAYERVGFLYVRPGYINSKTLLLLATKYMPVPDERYIKDDSVGARINSTAIRSTMQMIMDSCEGALHVHIHLHNGKPVFSRTDNHELSKLIPSLKTVGVNLPHGALLLSKDNFNAVLSIPKQKKLKEVRKLSIIGNPVEFMEANK